MGSFMDLVEANRQREHELKMQRSRQWRNIVLGTALKLTLFGAVGIAIRQALKDDQEQSCN